jgi:hypothetical protein
MAHVLCAFILILCLAVPAKAGKKRSFQKREPFPRKRYPAAENPLVYEMLRYLGVQYRRGGSSQGGLDCSGFVKLVYRNAYGLALPHQSGSLYISSGLQKITLDELKTGDLLFFTSSRKSRRINHVGIYLSEGRFVHATTRKGVIVSRLDEKYYSERIAGARRVLGQPQLRNADAGSFVLFAMGVSPGTLFDARENGAGLSLMSHSLGLEPGQDIQVSVFQDSIFSRTGTDLGYSFHDGSMGLEERALSAHVQGIRFERDIRPFPWLAVTPSLSYFDYAGDLDETGLPRRSIGLDLSLGSKEDAWRISTGFHYLSLIPPQRYVKEEHAPGSINMSLTYSRILSDGLTVSLIGERLQRYEATRELLQQERIFEDRRFSVVFNFSY